MHSNRDRRPHVEPSHPQPLAAAAEAFSVEATPAAPEAAEKGRPNKDRPSRREQEEALLGLPIGELPSSRLRHDRPPRMLVVEDDDPVRQALAELLREMGCEVVTARNGMEAVRTAGTFRPNVVLLDMCLPNLEGADVCRALRARADTAAVTIVGMSGFAGRGERALEAGCDSFLEKPVGPDDLREVLAPWLGAASGRGGSSEA